MKKIACLLFSCLLFFSCSKEKTAQPYYFHYEYFPLESGDVRYYDVDSTFYNDFDHSKTEYHFELKDTTVNYYLNISGDTTYRVERYKRTSPATDWQYQQTITKRLYKRYAEESIANQTFIKLLFPPSIYLTWNGNSKNNLGSQDYYIRDFLFQEEINGITYDSLLVVNQIEENNLIREDFSEETYAPHSGLVKKEYKAIDKDIYTGEITHGTILKMRIKMP